MAIKAQHRPVKSTTINSEHMRAIQNILLAAILTGTLLITILAPASAATWEEKSLAPVTNPIFFEDPYIRSEVHPFYMYHKLDKDFLTGGIGGGDIQVVALQLRWAVTDRLALIATKDGYVDADFDDVPSLSNDGFADIAFGVKYALIKSETNEFILTPGIKLEVPTGNTDVFQGNGDGEWDLFVSSAKNWDNLRAMGSVGVRVPNNWDDETAQSHYSVQLDYYTCPYFVPFVSLNAFTVLSEGDSKLPLEGEGFDLINFGARDSKGDTTGAVGVGFRTRVNEGSEFGFAFEHAAWRPRSVFEYRYTFDFLMRF
jgi:hypothetical protein